MHSRRTLPTYPLLLKAQPNLQRATSQTADSCHNTASSSMQAHNACLRAHLQQIVQLLLPRRTNRVRIPCRKQGMCKRRRLQQIPNTRQHPTNNCAASPSTVKGSRPRHIRQPSNRYVCTSAASSLTTRDSRQLWTRCCDMLTPHCVAWSCFQ
jgi:hypothetical protein